MEWLEESERSLDSELEIANDPDKIKTQLAQHKVGGSTVKKSRLCQYISQDHFQILDCVFIHHERKKILSNVTCVKFKASCPSHWSSGSGIFTPQWLFHYEPGLIDKRKYTELKH